MSEERARLFDEAAMIVHEFSWILPMYESPEVNLATDDAACAVQEQIAAHFRRLAANEREDGA